MIKSPSTQARPSAAVASTPGGGAADESIVWYSPMQVGQTPGVHRGTPGGGLLRRAVATPSRDALRVTPFSNQVDLPPRSYERYILLRRCDFMQYIFLSLWIRYPRIMSVVRLPSSRLEWSNEKRPLLKDDVLFLRHPWRPLALRE